jgi:hypothetical protein
LVYLMPIWYILWQFGIFFPFWYDTPRKIWQPCVSLPVRHIVLVIALDFNWGRLG